MFTHSVKGKEDVKVGLKVGGDAQLLCEIEGDNTSLFMLGIHNKELKIEAKKVEKDFQFPIKTDKKAKKKKGLIGKLKDMLGVKKKQEEPAEEQQGILEALQIIRE